MPYSLRLAFPAEAQQPRYAHKIGFLSRDFRPADSRDSVPHRLEAFRKGMRELGYVEGKNLIIPVQI